MDLNNGNGLNPLPPPLVVRQYVIETLNRWRENRRGQRWLFFAGWPMTPLNRLEAIFIAGNLRRELPMEGIGNKPQTTYLHVLGIQDRLSDEAVDVLCGFLQETPCHLVSLVLQGLPRQQLHRMLQALHHNTSVKELIFMTFHDENVDDLIGELLRHKNDLTSLSFSGFGRLRISDTLSTLLSGLTQLKKLVFDSCAIDDEAVQVLLNRKYPFINTFDLQINEITSDGLGFMARRIPVALPSLKNLYIAHNLDLLNSPENTRLFAQNVFPMLKQLGLEECGQDFGYIQIIKACEAAETIGKLEYLNIYTESPNQAMRSQLIESLPKMKVERLHCASRGFAWSDPALITALYKNTSIFKVVGGGMDKETYRQNIVPILQRNKLMANIEKDLLGGTPALPTIDSVDNIITPLGRWSRVLAEVGHERVGLRATPVYMILHAVLEWVEPMQPPKWPQQMLEKQQQESVESRPIQHVAEPDIAHAYSTDNEDGLVDATILKGGRSEVAETVAVCGAGSGNCQSGGVFFDDSNNVTMDRTSTAAAASAMAAISTVKQQSCLSSKRRAAPTTVSNTTKKPKSGGI